ncbi:DUF4858 domain-containing protein [Parabacteroides bouchesdurhonensis]|uniref:DUF4858 domain-containing protein n=1 Tax=Parabacteroides bouchesdurhonensis TaxID=1936995 RepID=UPI00164E6B5F|nr:DUF4858 domain-containing protein [Parabacteroides bouchesdurhonensis]
MVEYCRFTINKKLLIVFFICAYSTEYSQAQWTKKDSIRLQNILSGKEQLQLNPEVQKALKEGTLINLDKPADKMHSAPTTLPILKDFSEYLQIEDTIKQKRIAFKDLPPAVLMRYGLDRPLPNQKMMMNGMVIRRSDIMPYAERPTGIDFNYLISYPLSKDFRQREYNKKHAIAYKSYNSLPTLEVHNKQKKFRKEHRATLPLPLVTIKDSTKVKPLNRDTLVTDSILVRSN